MTIKTVYIHPGDILDVRFVFDEEEKPSKKTWEDQPPRQQDRTLLTMHSHRTIGYCDFSYSFRLNNIDGSLRRWLA